MLIRDRSLRIGMTPSHFITETTMKRFLILLLAALFSAPVLATPAQDSTIEKLLILTEAQKLNDSAIADSDDIIETTLKPVLQLDKMTEEKKKMTESFLNEYKHIVKEEFSWKKMMPDYIRIYRETFTEEELQCLITFYESPTGAIFIRKMPLIMDKTSDIMRQKMASILDRMNTALIESMNPASPPNRTFPTEAP